MKGIMMLIFGFLAFGCNQAPDSEQEISKESASQNSQQKLSFRGKAQMPQIVLISGDEEYRSEEALPQLAKILSVNHGFNCTVLFAQDPEKPGIVNPNYVSNIPGLESLETADLMIIFTRFRALPDEQMKYIDEYLRKGKPVIGMRTATHAFRFNQADFESKYAHYGNYYNGPDQWKGGFGRLVLGEHWISHHGKHGEQSTVGIIVSEAKGHPILNGIQDREIWGATDVYGLRLPLPGDAQALVLGQVTERSLEKDNDDPLLGMRPTDNKLPDDITKKDENGKEFLFNQNDPMMPVAWTRSYQIPGGKPGKCFATTMGASVDLLAEGTRRMLVNAVFWCLDLAVPEKANVELTGAFAPSGFAFHKDEFWDNRSLKISTLK